MHHSLFAGCLRALILPVRICLGGLLLCAGGRLAAMEVDFIGSLPTFVAAAPGSGATQLQPNAMLTWNFGGATSYDLYFGTTTPPPMLAAGLTVTSAAPHQDPYTRYYWKVDGINTNGTTSTAIFTFTTGAPPPSNGGWSGPCSIQSRIAADATAAMVSTWALPAVAWIGLWLVGRRREIRRRQAVRTRVTTP